MKKALNSIIWTVVFFLLVSTVKADLTDGLVGYWSFDEVSGNIAYDSANGYNGTIYGAERVTGVGGGSLSFDGDGDYVEVPDNDSLTPTDQITISFWVYNLKGGIHTGIWKNAACAGEAGSPGHSTAYYILINETDGTVGMRIYSSRDVSDIIVGDTAVPFGQWHHVSGTFDKGNASLYIDGQLEKSEMLSVSIIMNDVQPLTIGGYWEYCGTDELLGGKCILDEVRIYNRALSAEEIQVLYQLAFKPKRLEIIGSNEVSEDSQAQYKAIVVYDNNSTKDVTDTADWAVLPDTFAQINEGGLLETGLLNMPTEQVKIYAQYTQNEITVSDEKDVEIYSICNYGSALEFDGNSDFVNIGNKTSLEPAIFTLAAWINPSNITTLQHIAGKYGHKPVDNCAYGYRIAILDNGKFGLFVDPAGCSNTNPLKSSTTLESGQWYFVTGTYDGSVAKVYVNGTLEAEDTRILNSYYTKFQIGASYSEYHVSNWDLYDGIIDEVLVFNRVLSGEEIFDLMLTKPQSGDSSLVGLWSFDEGSGQIVHDNSGNGNDGYLGTDPCDVDDSDPAWIDSDAPIRCTREQMIERNLYGALEHKEIAEQEIRAAMDKELATNQMLLQIWREQNIKKPGPWQMWHNYYSKKCGSSQIWRAIQYVTASMTKEYNSIRQINQSIKDLENATEILGMNEQN